ncbi:MAG TPA: response regulator [Aquabacterium sp.]|uniref:response regulator n=1 Tax=Aquabacterium sp. TaxID=1872578 RepID=UPI002E358C61|nr:response regulator [Aquabacterium sp.]HEX5356231.1 response regulator [Aquabacterium sp.]
MNPGHAVNAPTNPLHLLVVDDDDVDRERVQRYMQRSPVKVVTHEASSGEEALRMVRTHPFDCVVLDNQLGDTTGMDLLQRLRTETCQDCPVIMVTGAGNEALVVQTLQEGAADYLSKLHLSADSLVRSVLRSLEHHQMRRELDDMHRQLERRVEEQAATIRLRERDLQDLLDHTSSLIGYWDAAQCVRFGNRAHEAWFGLLPEHLPGMRVRDAIGPAMYAIHQPYIERALQGQAQLFEHTLPGTNGIKTRHLQAEYRPDANEFGEVAGFYVTITDITVIKAAQAKVEELLHFVEAVIGNSPVGMAVYRHDHQCVLANSEMASLTGMSLAQLRQQPLAALATGPTGSLLQEAHATLVDGRTRHLEIAMQRSPEELVHLAWSLARLSRGDEPHLLVIARDVTEQNILHETLVSARNTAQEAARITSAFLANMSHEIRTPMNAIVGLSRLALEEALPPAAYGHIERVHDSALALMGILDDVLDYSKVEAGQMTLEHTDIDLEDTLQRVADLFSGRMAQKRLRFSMELIDPLPTHIVGDPLRLSQILNNLVGNAVKFTDKGGIHLEVRTDGDMLRFAVRDTGIGIDPERRQALFAAFAQGDVSITRRFGGTGLGLAISKRLIEMMEGRIGVHSTLGQGSEFWFTIPLLPAPAPDQTSPACEPYKVLLLGSTPAAMQALTRMLQSRQGVVTVSDDIDVACAHIMHGAQAGQPFDAVIIDWQQADEQAAHVVRVLRDQLRQHDGERTPVIGLIPGFERQALLDVTGASPVDTLLSHPILPGVLLKALEHARANHQSAPQPQASPAHLLEQRGLALRGCRVLLVEDNLLNQMVAQAFLQQAGLEVETLDDGQQAVQRMEQAPPGYFSAILMDMHMPVMDGLEASRRIQQMGHTHDIPIIAMTAAVLPADRERCLEAGMVDMITKPIMPETMVDTLLKWIPH